MMRTLRLNWLSRLTRRKDKVVTRPLLVASRDLPPIDAETGLALPRSPAPYSEEELLFASRAAARTMKPQAVPAADPRFAASHAAQRDAGLTHVATGADLRALLERFEAAAARRTALEQAADAHQRLAAVLPVAASAAPPMLRLVASTDQNAAPAPTPEPGPDREIATALGAALDALRRLSDEVHGRTDAAAVRRPTSPRR